MQQPITRPNTTDTPVRRIPDIIVTYVPFDSEAHRRRAYQLYVSSFFPTPEPRKEAKS